MSRRKRAHNRALQNNLAERNDAFRTVWGQIGQEERLAVCPYTAVYPGKSVCLDVCPLPPRRKQPRPFVETPIYIYIPGT